MIGSDFSSRVKPQGRLSCNLRFTASNMLFLEQELAIEVADVNSVQVNLKREMKDVFSSADDSNTIIQVPQLATIYIYQNTLHQMSL